MPEQNLDSMINPADSEPTILSRGNNQLSVVSFALPKNKIPWLRFWLEGIVFAVLMGFPIGFLLSRILPPYWVLTFSGQPIMGYGTGTSMLISNLFSVFLFASAYVALRVWFWRKRL